MVGETGKVMLDLLFLLVNLSLQIHFLALEILSQFLEPLHLIAQLLNHNLLLNILIILLLKTLRQILQVPLRLVVITLIGFRVLQDLNLQILDFLGPVVQFLLFEIQFFQELDFVLFGRENLVFEVHYEEI